jgi:hypothetical protein
METIADWIEQGRFGVLVYLGARYLFVVNTAGQYERARERPADYVGGPVRIWDEVTGRWETAASPKR